MATKTKSVFGWLAETVSGAVDAARGERVAHQATQVQSLLRQRQQQFDFPQAVRELAISKSDQPLVAEQVYRAFLERSWADGRISSKERELLAWLAGNLGISPEGAGSLNADIASGVFKKVLGKSLADGKVDEAEAERLRQVAEDAGHTVRSLMAQFFAKEGDALLRSVFTQAAEDGRLERQEWKDFCDTAQRLGIPKDRLLAAIEHPAHQLVEHALADARSDGEISDREERVLLSLLDNIIADRSFADYVRLEIAEARLLQEIAKGVLPTLLSPANIALRAGEIVHWHGGATFTRTRELASGTRVEETTGEAVVTDTRFILSSADKSLEIGHRKVIGSYAFGDEIDIRTASKAAGRYSFDEDGTKAVAIWQVAISRANQTIVASDDKQARRRIPRDVRQRVWQRYGGRCAECSADTYLEFDHIIPVAKGGSNSETNVQLLCRNCNLAKSDRI